MRICLEKENLMANTADILFIVEGKVAEPTLIDKLLYVFNIHEKYTIYSYETSIYELYEELLLDEDLDVALTLREKERDKRKKKKLSNKFLAIYLIFDFEPHDRKFDIEKIIKLNSFFNDPLEHGLLLINYPMVESFKHISSMPDENFINKCITKTEARKYKQLVGSESKYTNINVFHPSNDIALNIIIHHMLKLNYLNNKILDLPNFKELTDIINSEQFVKNQFNAYNNDSLPVVSTIYYFLVDLKQTTFYELINLPIIDEIQRKFKISTNLEKEL